MIELYIILGMMIVGAVIAIEVKRLLPAVITVGSVGMALALAFLLLKAPDIALTQLVVEIMAVVILIRATLNKEISSEYYDYRLLGGLIGLAFLVLATLAAMTAFRDLPAFGNPLMGISWFYPLNAVGATGGVNVVTSVILDFRAYDTLGEATVLFTAVIGVLTVLRPRGRKTAEEEAGAGNE
jgi:multicomponent Na+:H+ antiporter subunit B